MISTHVLDLLRGRPAAGVSVVLEMRSASESWVMIARGVTDSDGRMANLAGAEAPAAGTYRLKFDTGRYFQSSGLEPFYPEVQVTFELREPARHHHVPLLLSPYGYTTYRGS